MMYLQKEIAAFLDAARTKDQHRPTLTRVSVIPVDEWGEIATNQWQDGGKVLMATTDGYRLHVQSFPAHIDRGSYEMVGTALVPHDDKPYVPMFEMFARTMIAGKKLWLTGVPNWNKGTINSFKGTLAITRLAVKGDNLRVAGIDILPEYLPLFGIEPDGDLLNMNLHFLMESLYLIQGEFKKKNGMTNLRCRYTDATRPLFVYNNQRYAVIMPMHPPR